MDFTGERWIPGASDPRVEADHVARYRFAASYVNGRDVLDIACGAGGGSSWLARNGHARTILAMDVDSEAVAYGREHFAEDGLSFEHGDVEQLSFIDKFDVITCFETIEHVKDDARGLANLHRALRTGGLLLLSTPNRLITSPRADSILDRPENPFHVREYVQAELLNVISKVGFSIIAVKGQRFRTWFPSGTANMFLDRLRALRHFNPDRDSSEAVRSDHLMWKQPRILIVVATKP